MRGAKKIIKMDGQPQPVNQLFDTVKFRQFQNN